MRRGWDSREHKVLQLDLPLGFHRVQATQGIPVLQIW